jgi:hypothetical protein
MAVEDLLLDNLIESIIDNDGVMSVGETNDSIFTFEDYSKPEE